MTDDVSPDVIKNTQKLLGKHIKKPVLTDKLLKKPPFRFLHDIVSGIIRETGFFKGLYSDAELQSENVKDREAKVAFLTKLIDATRTIAQTDLQARPSKIISGLEATETNYLLQAVASAIDAKLDSSQYVAQLKGSKEPSSKSKSKPPRPDTDRDKAKKAPSKNETDRDRTRKSTSKNTPESQEKSRVRRQQDQGSSSNTSTEKNRSFRKDPSPRESMTKVAPKETATSKARAERLRREGSKDSERSSEKKYERPSNKDERNKADRQRDRTSNKENSKQGKSPRNKLNQEKISEVNSGHLENDDVSNATKSNILTNGFGSDEVDEKISMNETEINSLPFVEQNETLSKGNNHFGKSLQLSEQLLNSNPYFNNSNLVVQSLENENSETPLNFEILKNSETPVNNTELLKNSETSQKHSDSFSKDSEQPTHHALTRPKSARPRSGDLKRERTPSTRPNVNLDIEKETKIENSPIRPKSSLRPPSVRPSSARPGAPRLRPDSALPMKEMVPLGKINVIVENFSAQDDEEETVVIQSTAEVEPDPPVVEPILDMPADKGHLVEQILEQLQDEDILDNTKSNKVDIDWEQDTFRGRDSMTKEIGTLRNAIQILTRTANPLGKLMNFLHEDLEAMLSELETWTTTKRQIKEEIANQKRINEEITKPLRNKLVELEENIKKQEDEISAMRAEIIRNDMRIKELLLDQI